MSSLWFVFKCVVLSLILIVIMQIRWDGHTLEQHATRLVYSTSVTGYVHEAGEGLAKKARGYWQDTKSTAKKKFEQAADGLKE